MREANPRLYAILDMGYVKPGEALESARRLVATRPAYVQLRAKGWDAARVLELAREVAAICRAGGVKFIVNDFIDVALACGADGVHLGQDDGPLADARAQLPPGAVVGRSTHSPAQAIAAVAEGADYIGFGPLYATDTKPGRTPIGLADVARVQASLPPNFPVFCIGGINRETLAEVVAAGAQRVVIVSWLLAQSDFQQAAREVSSLWDSPLEV